MQALLTQTLVAFDPTHIIVARLFGFWVARCRTLVLLQRILRLSVGLFGLGLSITPRC